MYDIITIGTATRDVFLSSRFFKVIRDKKHLRKENGFPTGEAQCFTLGGKIEIGKPILTTGGGATNAAVTFSRQGFKTAALIKVGKDQDGEDILSELKKGKIDVLKPRIADRESETANIGTAYSAILLAPNGEQTILVYRGVSGNLSAREIPFEKLKSKWAYIAPGKISFSAMEKIFNYLYKNKILIAFNPSKHFIAMGIKKLKPFLEKSKAVILNREEAAYLTGIDYHKENEIFKKLDEVAAGIAVMTCGESGVSVSDGYHMYKAGIFKEKSDIDHTGAGDAFGSGFVSGLVEKQEECKKGLCGIGNIEYAIRLGTANATSVIEYIGAKKGILTKDGFKKNKRWDNLAIKVSKLR